ncbi:MAG: CDP-alcohol phosphatidyltransferase family protein [Gammaproteobacteria bacterium]|nr:CDP-alcohol phosphatidyltransferase family protein [Gammaproteobacteria bacterium]
MIYSALFVMEGSAFATQWLILSTIVLVIVIIQTIHRLDKNCLDENSSPYSSLGWGNRATIFRGVLIAALAGFLMNPWPGSYLIWLPGCIYTIAAIIDRVDGYLARITKMESQLGAELDTVYDAIGLLIAPLLAVVYGQLHWSYLLVSIAYYLFVLGIYLRKFRGQEVYRLPANISRRAIAGFQMGFVAAVLLPIFKPPITQMSGIAFMLPLLIGFCVDWLIVRGSLVAGTDKTLVLERLKVFGRNFLLPALRLMVLILATGLIYDAELHQTQHILILIIAGGAIFLIVTGIAGRAGSAILAILMGLYYQDQDVSLFATILLFSITWIMMLGTGRFSLYKWDEDWVNRYDGA